MDAIEYGNLLIAASRKPKMEKNILFRKSEYRGQDCRSAGSVAGID
jgi:hypothetical protein